MSAVTLLRCGTDRVRPRPVFCPIEHRHRDLGVADDVLAGRFHHAGTTLHLGPRPDWRTDGLPDDEEWHIEWSKFYAGLDLAHAYAVRVDERYVQAWQDLVDGWIEQQHPRIDSSDVTARRVQNWIYAWQGFEAVPGFPGLDPDFEARLLASLADQLDHITLELTPERNHRTLELYGLLVASLALPVLDPDGARLAHAWGELQANLLTDVWADGVHRERSSHYHLIALRSFLAARVNVLRFGLDVPAAYDERLRAACRFALHLHRPDGQIPALSDSDSGTYHDLLELAGDSLGLDDLRWVASGGREGHPPAERCVSFPVGGYHVQRSGWGDGDASRDERFLVLGCGPLGDGGHGHYDALGLEAYGLGHPLVVDPGRYTYAEGAPGTPNWRHWFKGTAAHNTVQVDGLDQQPYRRGRPKGPQLRCTLLEERAGEGLHLLRGEVLSPSYDAVHRRAVLFVGGDYWLVHDELRADLPHDYVARWHLAEETAPRVVRRPGGSTSATTPTVRLESVGGARTSVEPGWVSREYGVRTPAPVVAVGCPPQSADADLLTLLAPRRDGRSARLVRADPAVGTVTVLTPDGGTDHLGWRTPGQEVSAGGLHVAGEVVWLRTDREGRLARVAVQHPTSVRWTGPGPGPLLRVDAGWHAWTRTPRSPRSPGPS